MKKRIILLLLVLFIVTGCKAEYELEFVDYKLIETVKVSENIELYNKEMPVSEATENDTGSTTYGDFLNSYKNSKHNAFTKSDKGKYKQEEIRNDNEFGLVYSYKFLRNNYTNSSLANSCNTNFKFYELDNKYAISTDKLFTCFANEDLDTLTIHIKSNHKVNESNVNADEIDGYNYYWHITRNNYNNKRIYIEFYKDKYVFNYENKTVKTILIVSGIAILCFVVIISLRKKVKRQNEW